MFIICERNNFSLPRFLFSGFAKHEPTNLLGHSRNYFFLRGQGNESCNLIGSLPGQYFPISAHGPR